MKGLPDQKRMVVAGVEIAGGMYGLVASMPQLVSAERWPHQVIFAVAAAFYVTSFVAGMLLLRNRRAGITLSIYLTWPQLLSVKTSLITFALYSGARIGVYIPPLGFQANLASGFDFGFRGYQPDPQVGINLLAIYFLFLLIEQREILDAPPPVDRVVTSNSTESPD